MIETLTLSPGVTLRCFRDTRFKQGRLTVQFVRPMSREEASLNALLPAVLLRGTEIHPDLRSITMYLDDLYGAAVGDLVRRIGDYQTTGLSCTFTEDRFALPGDQIEAPAVDFLRELLLCPKLEKGAFCREFVESEKKNLLADLESQKNDKQTYAANRLMELMCSADSFGIPRLGTKENLQAITPESLYRHYRMLLETAPVEIFYVGSREAEDVAALLEPLFRGVERNYVNLEPQTPFHDNGQAQVREKMDITQSRLNMGFVTDITNRSGDFAAMQVLNALFGGGMTSKLFMTVREKMSLCYSIGSGYYGSKGILTVGAGIDGAQADTVRREVLNQLQACQNGDITPSELESARQYLLSGLRTVHDSPGSIEGYYATAALSGLSMTLEEYRHQVSAVDIQRLQSAAQSLRFHSEFFLEGQ